VRNDNESCLYWIGKVGYFMENNRPQDAGFNAGVAFSIVFLVVMFSFVLVAMLSNRTHVATTTTTVRDSVEVAQITAEPTRITSMPTPVGQVIAYTGANVSQGKSYFGASCSGCHGSDGRGIAGLGKNLIESEFVSDLNDQELHDFIVTGRSAWDPANTTGVDMPAKGGNPALTDDNIYQIIAYLRTQSDPSLFVQDSHVDDDTSAEVVVSEPTAAPTLDPAAPTATVQIVVGIDPQAAPTQVFDPEAAYNWSCAGCHGLDGRGIAGNGSDLFTSSLVTGNSSDALFNFIITGNQGANPAVEFPHPVRGEYPGLTDEQVQAVIEYIRTLPTR
jgi:mono/diheme cytochrome c family protein